MFAVLLTFVHDVIAIQEEFTLTVVSPFVLYATKNPFFVLVGHSLDLGDLGS